MKLCFTVKRLEGMAGGAERVLATVMNGLLARGHQITLVSFDAPGAASFYPLDERITWTQLAVGDSGVPVSPLVLMKRIVTLRRILKAERPDLAVGFMHSSFIPTALAGAGTGIPVAGSEHISADHYKDRHLDAVLYRVAALFLKKITVLSEQVKAGFPPSLRRKMAVISNPVMKPPVQDAFLRPEPVILAVGRLDAQKDQATLIAAFARLAAHHPDWRLQIVGDGPLKDKLRAQIATAGLESRITLTPPTPDIGNLYSRARIFAMPSRYESFGMATVEAMMFALPCIGFEDCPGTNEIIKDGVTGLLVEGQPDRIAALAQGLDRLMGDTSAAERLGQSGLTAAHAYAVAPVLDRWEKFLEAALA